MRSADNRFGYLDKDGEPLPAGSSLDNVGRFEFECRTDPRSRCSVNLQNAGYSIPSRNWKLTGSVDAPTIAPSINCAGCWHGFIENGVFVKVDKQREEKQ